MIKELVSALVGVVIATLTFSFSGDWLALFTALVAFPVYYGGVRVSNWLREKFKDEIEIIGVYCWLDQSKNPLINVRFDLINKSRIKFSPISSTITVFANNGRIGTMRWNKGQRGFSMDTIFGKQRKQKEAIACLTLPIANLPRSFLREIQELEFKGYIEYDTVFGTVRKVVESRINVSEDFRRLRDELAREKGS